MRRTSTVLLTLALIGSLAVMGFAGTAAAGGEDHHDDKPTGDLGIAGVNIEQGQDVSQANQIEQNALQFADQNATGVDIDFGDINGDDGDNGDNGNGALFQGEVTNCEYPDGPAISNIQFYDTDGNLLVKFEWTGTSFEPEGGDAMGVTITDVEFKEPNEPNLVRWTSEEPISEVVVKAGTTECDFPGDTSAESMSNNGNSNDDGTTDGTSIEGSVGNQMLNQTLEQSVDASNNNGQTATGSAFSGKLAALIAG
ncbi:hypothetical protein [Natrinema gari]|uniref:Uncharacterized protein n=1 Tax=Natrinema gari JCM 14663 TaxID=1230459 RepID=L9Z9F6_9EURY|nr:hypothetical protein [Natrinema gari]ELY82282.1 hypothetical protein C486_04835 [Natrinema gari JCM 14663]